MSFAVIQMVSQSDVLANLAQARRLLERAAAGGGSLRCCRKTLPPWDAVTWLISAVPRHWVKVRSCHG